MARTEAAGLDKAVTPALWMTLAACAWALMWLPMAWGMGPGLELPYMAGLLSATLCVDVLCILCLGSGRIRALTPALTSRTPLRWTYGLFTAQFALLPYASRLLDPAVVAALVASYPVWFVLAGALAYRGLVRTALLWRCLCPLLALGVGGGALAALSLEGGAVASGGLGAWALGLGAVALALALMTGVLAMGRLALAWSRETGMPQYWCWVAGRIPVIAVCCVMAGMGTLLWPPAAGLETALLAGALAGLCNLLACRAYVAGLSSGRGVGAQTVLCLESPMAVLLLWAAGLGGDGVDWRLLAPGLALSVAAAVGVGVLPVSGRR